MIRERYLDVRGGRTRCLEAGSGWPVVLVHAFPLSADMWRPQLERVPAGWRFVAPDLRGFRGSVVTVEHRSPGAQAPEPVMEDYAGDLLEVMDRLEIERAVIGGVSMGGYITMAMFRLAPDRFTGTILADTRSTADTPEGREARDRMRALALAEGPGAVADQMLPKLLGPTTTAARPALVQEVRAMIERNSPAAIAGALHALRERPDSTAALATLPVPALILCGEEDTLTPPADSEALHRTMPRSHLVILPGAGHLASLEAPGPFSRAMEDFLRSSL